MTTQRDQPPSNWAAAMSFGTTVVAYVALFTLGGYYLDRRLGSGPAFTLIGFLLGIAGATYELWKLLRSFAKPPPPPHDPDPPDDRQP